MVLPNLIFHLVWVECLQMIAEPSSCPLFVAVPLAVVVGVVVAAVLLHLLLIRRPKAPRALNGMLQSKT